MAPRAKLDRPLRVGDRVRCLCLDPHLRGQVVIVLGLRVLSCQGHWGIAVTYNERGYSVVAPHEIERIR